MFKVLRWIFAVGCLVYTLAVGMKRKRRLEDLEARVAGLEQAPAPVASGAAANKVVEKKRNMQPLAVVTGRAGDTLIVDGERLGKGQMGRLGLVLAVFEGRYGLLLDYDGNLKYLCPYSSDSVIDAPEPREQTGSRLRRVAAAAQGAAP